MQSFLGYENHMSFTLFADQIGMKTLILDQLQPDTQLSWCWISQIWNLIKYKLPRDENHLKA